MTNTFLPLFIVEIISCEAVIFFMQIDIVQIMSISRIKFKPLYHQAKLNILTNFVLLDALLIHFLYISGNTHVDVYLLDNKK